MSVKDTIVKCSKCNKEKKVNFECCLGNGWPKCCGYTMTIIITKANIENILREKIRNAPVTLHTNWSCLLGKIIK